MIKNLTQFLEDYDVEVLPLENIDLIKLEQKFEWTMPNEMVEYYKNFGGINSSDFMYNLKHLSEFIILTDSDWEFTNVSFDKDMVKDFIVFSEIPENDSLCINKNSGEIFFSHDHIKCAKLYKKFNDFLISEIINIEELMGDLEFKNRKD